MIPDPKAEILLGNTSIKDYIDVSDEIYTFDVKVDFNLKEKINLDESSIVEEIDALDMMPNLTIESSLYFTGIVPLSSNIQDTRLNWVLPLEIFKTSLQFS